MTTEAELKFDAWVREMIRLTWLAAEADLDRQVEDLLTQQAFDAWMAKLEHRSPST